MLFESKRVELFFCRRVSFENRPRVGEGISIYLDIVPNIWILDSECRISGDVALLHGHVWTRELDLSLIREVVPILAPAVHQRRQGGRASRSRLGSGAAE